MEVFLEIFFTRVAGEQILYQKECEEITGETVNPDRLVHRVLLKKFPNQNSDGSDIVVHSTSWRHEAEGKLLLTYMVYSDTLPFIDKMTCCVNHADLNITTCERAAAPHPELVQELAVLAHGYRHLGFLVQNEPEIRQAVSGNEEALALFGKISPDLAGVLVYQKPDFGEEKAEASIVLEMEGNNPAALDITAS